MPAQLREQALGDQSEMQLALLGISQNSLGQGLFGQLAERLQHPGTHQVVAPRLPSVRSRGRGPEVRGGLQDTAFGERGAGDDRTDRAHLRPAGGRQPAVHPGERVR